MRLFIEVVFDEYLDMSQRFCWDVYVGPVGNLIGGYWRENMLCSFLDVVLVTEVDSTLYYPDGTQA